MDDGVVDEGNTLLAVLVPAPRILLIRVVEVGVGAERRQERGLVVRRAAHPAVGQPRPLRDGVAARDQILEGFRRLEEGVGHAAIAGVGRQQKLVLALGIAQRIVKPRHHLRGVAKGLVLGDVLDPFAINEDLASVAERSEVVGAGLRRRDVDFARGLGSCRKGFAIIGSPNDGGHRFLLLSQRGTLSACPIVVSSSQTTIRRRESRRQRGNHDLPAQKA